MTIPPITERTTCRACGSDHLTPLFSLGTQYVNAFPDQAEVEAGYPNCPHCPIELELCRECTLVQLHHTAPQELLYSRHYHYRSGITETMRNALKDVAMAAEALVDLQDGDVVLDIGSNDGTLLRCFRPGLVRVGVEPADNLATPENYEGLTLIHDFWPYYQYTNEYGPAKIVTALGMMYDTEEPQKFIDMVDEVLHPDGVFVAQLMCLRQTVESGDCGNYVHEHLEYYSLKCLHRMLEKAGLGIFNVESNSVNGGSYRLWVCHRGAKGIGVPDGAGERVVRAFAHEVRMGLDNPSVLMRHYHDMLGNAMEVKSFVLREVAKGKKVWVLGASTKGNAILQFFGLDHTMIDGAADRDPRKWGKYMVGGGIPIMSEEAMRQLMPDFGIILPYSFKDEIMERERDQPWRKRGGKFLIPLPKMEVL